jgi:uncharacterized membrane protein
MMSFKNNLPRLVISVVVALCLYTANVVNQIVDVKITLICDMVLTISGQEKKWENSYPFFIGKTS